MSTPLRRISGVESGATAGGGVSSVKVEHSGRRRPLISLSVVAGIGILLSIVGGVVMHLLWLYLTGIVIAAVCLGSIVVRMTSPTDNASRLPARVGALVTVLVLAGAAITVPWLTAKQQRRDQCSDT